MKDFILKLKKAAQERAKEVDAKIESATDTKEVRSLYVEARKIDDEIKEYDEKLVEIEAEEARNANPGTGEGVAAMDPPTGAKIESGAEGRGQQPQGKLNPMGTYGAEQRGNTPEDRSAKKKEEAEKRGQALIEGRSVTVASNVLLASYTDSTLNPTFNEVSSLVDRVTTKPLIGGESYSKGYVKGYGTADYTDEGADYNSTEPTFGYADITKTKITAYAEDTEELLKLSAANYDAEVVKGVTIATRKKITREILIGDGNTGHLVGIFSTKAVAIDPSTDLPISEINESTLDNIIFSYGGDEDVEDTAVLILNKKDLKAFSTLRNAFGNKVYNIVSNGNTGTINSVPYIINSACNAISDSAVAVGAYSMAYGSLSTYLLTVFSEMDVQRSTDYKFKEGMIANKSSIFVGGNVVSKNGFLRIKKAAVASS
jgi:HK97 family phage major capsid protein